MEMALAVVGCRNVQRNRLIMNSAIGTPFGTFAKSPWDCADKSRLPAKKSEIYTSQAWTGIWLLAQNLPLQIHKSSRFQRNKHD